MKLFRKWSKVSLLDNAKSFITNGKIYAVALIVMWVNIVTAHFVNKSHSFVLLVSTSAWLVSVIYVCANMLANAWVSIKNSRETKKILEDEHFPAVIEQEQGHLYAKKLVDECREDSLNEEEALDSATIMLGNERAVTLAINRKYEQSLQTVASYAKALIAGSRMMKSIISDGLAWKDKVYDEDDIAGVMFIDTIPNAVKDLRLRAESAEQKLRENGIEP